MQYFGTDGIRGRVGVAPIDVASVLKLGWAVGQMLKGEGESTVLIGRDTRISGVALQSALQAGLSAAGVHVKLIGVVPTPAVAYLTHSLRATAGVMITASHNLYVDNGLKFFNHAGMKLTDQQERAIERYMDAPFEMVPADKMGSIETLSDAGGRYIEFCKSIFPSQLSLEGLRLVLDCAHGAGYRVGPSVMRELGADVVVIGDAPTGVNINQACGSTHLDALQKAVVSERADVGIALDGDGDRLIMVDHLGRVVDGDQLLFILARESSTGFASRSGIVGTLMSNLGLEQALYANGIDFKRAKVGDRYVLEEMQKHGWVLGGESSGHIIDLDYTTTGDGIVTALQILRVMQMTGQSVDQLTQAMKMHPQVMINVPMEKSCDVADFPGVAQAVEEVEAQLKGRGRVLLRASGTEACMRVMVEGSDAIEVEACAKMIAARVADALKGAVV